MKRSSAGKRLGEIAERQPLRRADAFEQPVQLRLQPCQPFPPVLLRFLERVGGVVEQVGLT